MSQEYINHSWGAIGAFVLLSLSSFMIYFMGFSDLPDENIK
jgi:hypothetical protein